MKIKSKMFHLAEIKTLTFCDTDICEAMRDIENDLQGGVYCSYNSIGEFNTCDINLELFFNNDNYEPTEHHDKMFEMLENTYLPPATMIELKRIMREAWEDDYEHIEIFPD